MSHEENIYYEINFGQVMVNQTPRMLEADEIYKPLFPHEARLRNLTYSTEMYVYVSVKKLRQIPKNDKQNFIASRPAYETTDGAGEH